MIWDSAPNLAPKISPDKTTKKDCSVIGTGPRGIEIKPPTTVSEVNNAVIIKSRVDNLKINSSLKNFKYYVQIIVNYI